MSELIHLLQTPAPLGWTVLYMVLGMLLCQAAYGQYRSWRLGRIIRAAALKAINAPTDEISIISMPDMTPDERADFYRRFDELVSSEKRGKKVDLK